MQVQAQPTNANTGVAELSEVFISTASVWEHNPRTLFSHTESFVEIEVLEAARRVLLVGNCYLEVEVFLRELPEAEFVIVDKSKDQLTRIERGLSGNQQKERLHLITADISDQSLFPDGKEYDLIVLSAIDISCFSPDTRAYEILHRIANNLQKWLAPGGILNHFTKDTQKFYGAALQSGALSLLDQASNLKCVFRKNQLNAEE